MARIKKTTATGNQYRIERREMDLSFMLIGFQTTIWNCKLFQPPWLENSYKVQEHGETNEVPRTMALPVPQGITTWALDLLAPN